MTEEELEQLLANSRMQGSSSPGWGAAAGAMANVENRLIREFDERLAKKQSERKDPMYPWRAGTTTVEERGNTPEAAHFKTDLELLVLWIQKNPDTAEKILKAGIGAAVGTPVYTTYKTLEWLALNAPGYLKKWGFKSIPIEELGGRKEKDETEGPDPLGPAPEIPEYDPLEFEEFERSPPSWLTRGDYITDLDAWNDVEPVFDYPDELKPGSLLTGLRDTDPRVTRYNELMPPYRSAVEAFSKEEQDWFDKAPDANLYDMATYLGESVSPRIKAESLRDAGYSPGPDFGWEGDPSANEEFRKQQEKEFEEFRKQQEFAERNNREDYNAMVADMVETERLRQADVASTPGFNEYSFPFGQFPSDQTYSMDMTRHPPLDNQLLDLPEWGSNTQGYDAAMTALSMFLGAGEAKDYLYRLRPDVGQPIDQPISQEEIILNQTRPGGGIGLSEQIINQSKPGAYIYPGMLN